MRPTRALFALALFLLAGCGRGSEEWSQFRGPDGLGIAPEGPLPLTWGEDGTNVRWRTPLPGVGHSSPVVHAGRIYLTAAEKIEGEPGRLRRTALAVDLDSGELLWRKEVFTGPKEPRHRLNSAATPTPAAAEDGVFVYFGSVLARLGHDGEILWQKEVEPGYLEDSLYGAASSPVLTRDAVVTVRDRERGNSKIPGWLAAFDRETGERLWRHEWTNTCCAYSTPVVLDRNGLEEILFARSGGMVVYDAETGQQLWSRGYPINQIVAGPVTEDDILGISGGAHNVRHTIFLRLPENGGWEPEPEVLWESNTMVPETSSPVLYRGLFFTVTDAGVLVCYDAESGEMLWRTRLSHNQHRPSLIAGDGKVYAVSRTGWTAVVAAAREYELLADNHLGVWGSNASPAVADGCLLIRAAEELFKICSEEG